MELRGENVVAPDGRGEGLAVSRARGDDRVVGGPREETVHKVNVTAVGNSSKEGAGWLREFNLVPANLRNLQSIPF